MASLQFACPHCTKPFEVEDSAAGQAMACPNCNNLVGLPTELSAAASEAEPGSSNELTTNELTGLLAPSDSFDFRGERTSILARSRSTRKKRASKKNVIQLSRHEKLRRQQRRSLLMMVFGLAVLFIAVIVLSRY